MKSDNENMQFLEQDFLHFVEINNLQHDNIITKLDVINVILEKDLDVYEKRLGNVEEEVEDLNKWKTYAFALVTIMIIIIPYLIQIIWPS